MHAFPKKKDESSVLKSLKHLVEADVHQQKTAVNARLLDEDGEPQKHVPLWRPVRLSKRGKLEQRLLNYQMNQWLAKHSLHTTRNVEMSESQKSALKECFDVLDTDGSGSIGASELQVAMKALGFDRAQVQEALIAGDTDGDGEMDFDEFANMIVGGGWGGTEANNDDDGDAGGNFPFALIANSYRISRLVDSYNPANRVEKQPATYMQATSSSSAGRTGGNLPPLQPSASGRHLSTVASSSDVRRESLRRQASKRARQPKDGKLHSSPERKSMGQSQSMQHLSLPHI